MEGAPATTETTTTTVLNKPLPIDWEEGFSRMNRASNTLDIMSSLGNMYSLVIRNKEPAILERVRDRLIRAVNLKQQASKILWTSQCSDRFSIIIQKLVEMSIPLSHRLAASKSWNSAATAAGPSTTQTTLQQRLHDRIKQNSNVTGVKRPPTSPVKEGQVMKKPKPFEGELQRKKLVTTSADAVYLNQKTVAKLAAKALPKTTFIDDEAKNLIQECASEFLLFGWSEARDYARSRNKPMVDGTAIVRSLLNLGFTNQAAILELYNKKIAAMYKQVNEKRNKQAQELLAKKREMLMIQRGLLPTSSSAVPIAPAATEAPPNVNT